MPDLNNPNRLDGLPKLGEPAPGIQPVANAGVSPTGIAALTFSPVVGLVLGVVGVIAGSIAALPAAGVGIPPVVVAICGIVGSVLTALGINSAGARKKE